MTAAFFPDTTVLVNFQVINRWAVLTELVKDGAVWVASVEDECRDWVDDHPDIHAAAALIFGTAIRPEPAEQINIRIARNDMADPTDDHPTKHLGEAETIVIIQSRFQGSRFITDDKKARAAATAQGIQCYGTGDLLVVAEAKGLISAADRASDLVTLRTNGHYPQAYFS